MGWLFSSTKSDVSNSSRDLYRFECPDDEQGRDQAINELTRLGHRVTGYLSSDYDYQPVELPEEQQQAQAKWWRW
jgi:hypothetical protein